MKSLNINKYLISSQEDEKLKNIEKLLKARYLNETDEFVKQELLVLLLICMLKENVIETQEMDDLYNQMESITRNLEKKLKNKFKKDNSFSNKLLLDVFYKTNLYRLFYLDMLYNQKNLSNKADQVKVLRKDLERAEAIFNKNYISFLGLYSQKIFSNYGTSYRYLFTMSTLFVLMFALYAYFHDAYIISHYGIVSHKLITGETLETFSWYMYLSLCTYTNLGADMSIAVDIISKVAFGLEQILGVIVMGFLITVIANTSKEG